MGGSWPGREGEGGRSQERGQRQEGFEAWEEGGALRYYQVVERQGVRESVRRRGGGWMVVVALWGRGSDPFQGNLDF